MLLKSKIKVTKAGIMNTSTEVMILVNRAVHLGLSAFRSMNSQVDHVFNVCSFVKEHDMNMQSVLHFCSSCSYLVFVVVKLKNMFQF